MEQRHLRQQRQHHAYLSLHLYLYLLVFKVVVLLALLRMQLTFFEATWPTSIAIIIGVATTIRATSECDLTHLINVSESGAKTSTAA